MWQGIQMILIIALLIFDIFNKKNKTMDLPLDTLNFFIENFVQRGKAFVKPQLISSVDNVGDFFKHYNTIFASNYHNLIMNKTIHIMKDNIEPIWECEQNKCGGIITFVVYLKNVTVVESLLDFYLDLLLLFIGNTFHEKLIPKGDDINGISFSKRKYKVLIKIWHKNSENEPQLENIINNELSKKSLDTMKELQIYSYYQIINQKLKAK